jgi:large-conductance mechanosensitive channel
MNAMKAAREEDVENETETPAERSVEAWLLTEIRDLLAKK